MTKKPTYHQLFLSTLQLSAFTFGGGFVMIPLMRKKFVEKLGWIDEGEMLDITAIAQSSPGAIAVNASILIGYRTAGPAGALVTVLGTVLPPLVILSIISFFYAAVRDNIYVGYAMRGMSAGVAAIILDVVFTMGGEVLRSRRALPAIMLAGAFLAVAYLKWNIILVLLVCGVLGAFDTLRQAKQEGGGK